MINNTAFQEKIKNGEKKKQLYKRETKSWGS